MPVRNKRDEPEICNFCNGSGEGYYEWHVCKNCHGSGYLGHPYDLREDDSNAFDQDSDIHPEDRSVSFPPYSDSE